MKKSMIFKVFFGFLFSFIFYTFAYSADVARASRTNTRTTAASQTISARDNRSDQCPMALVEWVKDDFENKYWNFGLMKLPGERERQCLKSVKDYEASLKRQKGKAPSIADGESLTKALAARNPKISPNYSLDLCNKLPEGQDQVVKTRYYNAMTKIEAANSTILDEIAHYDSLLEGEQKTASLYCNPAYPFPQVAKKCSDLKSKLGTKECTDRREEQITSYTFKTMKALEDLRELNKAKEECHKVHGKKTCEASPTAEPYNEFTITSIECTGGDISVCSKFDGMISMIHAKYPWIKGKKFAMYAGQARWGREKDPDKIASLYKKGIQEQLKEDRDLYAKQYEKNIENANCLTFSDSRGKAKCDFKELRSELSNMPNMKQPSPKGEGNTGLELQLRDEAESCIIDNSQNRETFKSEAAGAQFFTATILANAIPVIGMPAGRMISGISSLSKFKNINIARGSLASAATAGTLALGAKEVYEACENAGKEVLKHSEKKTGENDADLTKANLCPASTSKFEQSVEAYDDCVMNALFASADVWPFVKALKMTQRFMSNADKELLALYKSQEQRKRVEEILAKNGKMNEVERKAAAEELLGRKLSPEQKDCIIAAHNIAGDKSMKIDRNSTGSNHLDGADLRAKNKHLTNACNLSTTDAFLLTRSGITGNSDFERLTLEKLHRAALDAKPGSEESIDAFKKMEDRIRDTPRVGRIEHMSAEGTLIPLTSRRSITTYDRLASGHFDAAIDDIIDSSVNLSRQQNNIGLESGSRRGRSVTALLDEEDANLKELAEAALKDSRRATDSTLAARYELEAWNLMRAREELLRQRSFRADNGELSENSAELSTRLEAASRSRDPIQQGNRYTYYEQIERRYQQSNSYDRTATTSDFSQGGARRVRSGTTKPSPTSGTVTVEGEKGRPRGGR